MGKKLQGTKNSIHLAPEFRMQCTNVDDFKIKLWNQFSCHVKGIATIPVNLQEPYSVQENSNIEIIQVFILIIASYFIFQKNNRSIFINNTMNLRVLQLFSTPALDINIARVEMIIYVYSEVITSSGNWDRFHKDCVRSPGQLDRAGATSEEVIQLLIRQLYDRWRGK
jgi:hypothetical protein